MFKIEKILLFLSLILSTSVCIFGQSEPQKLSIGFNAGGTKYFGEFTDNEFGLGGDIFARYNITSGFSVMAVYGFSQIRWRTDETAVKKYPAYFGEGAKVGDYYPNSQPNGNKYIVIKERNITTIISLETYFTYNLFVNQSFVPYLFAGAGFMTFDPQTGDKGDEPLPNNSNFIYDKKQYLIPFGIGFELYLTQDLVINGRGTFRYTATDYLDDLSPAEDAKANADNDYFMTFAAGFSYYIFGKTDSDKDGLPNDREIDLGTDPYNPDTDGDGLKDGEEVLTYFTNPLKVDTDGDLLTDYDEIVKYLTNPLKADTDGDGINDGEEITRKTDPNNPDTDSDSLSDGDEIIKYKTNPLVIDTDSDGLNDGNEVYKYKTDPLRYDTDGDKLNDGDEVLKYKSNPLLPDTDSDGLNDGEEALQFKTNPIIADTDGDGLSDGVEVHQYKTNPLNPDTDNDKFKDGKEVFETKTDPLNPDTDGDKVIDGEDACPLTPGVKDIDPKKNGCPLPPKIGTKTDFPDILFKVNTDEFNYDFPATALSLAKLLDYVNQCEGIQFRLGGHSSAEGNPKRNQELSEFRAEKVKQWLILQNVNPDKIKGVIGYGANQPKIADPSAREQKKMSKADIEDIRKQNRRISVEITRTCDEGKK
jgi:outer membrane protein OmpA-like peptidoglycan-associated protein